MAAPEFVKRADGTGWWRVYVWNPYLKQKEWVINPEQGKSRFFTENEAKKFRDRAYAEMVEHYETLGRNAPRHGNTKVMNTFREWAPQWLDTQSGKRGSRNTREIHIEYALKHWDCADKSLQEYTRSDVEALRRRMEEVPYRIRKSDGERLFYSRQSIMNYMGDIVRCLRDAHRAGLRRDDPLAGYHVTGSPRRKVRILNEVELEKIVGVAPRWFGVAFYLAHDCGLRAGEVAGLPWSNVHLDAEVPYATVGQMTEYINGSSGILITPYTKGKKTGDVPLTERVVAGLRELRDWQLASNKRNPHGLVFPAPRTGGPMTPRTPNLILRRLWKQWADELDLHGECPVFHHLRHATGTKLAEADAPAYVIKAVLRHESLQTSQRYIDRQSASQLAQWQHRSLARGRAHLRVVPDEEAS